MKFLLIMMLGLGLLACESAPKRESLDINPQYEGLVLIRVNIGNMRNHWGENQLRFYFSKGDGLGYLDSGAGEVVAEGPYADVLVPLDAGDYSLGSLVWHPDLSLALNCLGTFEVEAGTVTYVGDFYFSRGRTEANTFASENYYNYGLVDLYDAAAKRLDVTNKSLLALYPLKKSVIGPSHCESLPHLSEFMPKFRFY